MDDRERPPYEPPLVEDLGTLEEITGASGFIGVAEGVFDPKSA
jgi:hypothetical protein